MRIISPYKDYYDHIGQKYGGGDPKIVYSRHRISSKESIVFEVQEFPFADPCSWPASDADFSLAYLIVAGKAYLVSRPRNHLTYNLDEFKVANPEEVIKRDSVRRTRGGRVYYYRRHFGTRKHPVEFGKQYPFLIDLSRKVCAPVFVVRQIQTPWRSGVYKVEVDGRCPILSRMGMPSLISPEQMYQDLAYFVGNTMNPSPDVKPPVEVSNNCKIVAAGFDLRQSFRHRK